MTSYRNTGFNLLLAIFLTGAALSAHAGMWDNPKNIKALSEDITADELRATMRKFATDTGSRCSGCHVGEDENDLSTYDFSLDDKEKKLKAREMIRMVADINSQLERVLEKSPEQLVQVDCATCHRGNSKPEMIQEVLARTYQDKGMQEAGAEYRNLRERYYGGYTFDFSERALMILAERMAGDDDAKAALGFLKLNLEFYPQSSNSYVLQGQVLAASGDKTAAKESYQQALEIQPGNPWTQQLLDALDNETATN